MSKRHQSHRRKAYGRRQHEVRERHEREQHVDASMLDLDWGSVAPADPLTFVDPRSPRLRFALGD
jgi:hypothetical protein